MAEEETSKRIRKSPQERRAEVLDAAVQLISERGFNGISIQDVADRVGISKQGVLRYVDNKDKMLALVYDEYYGQTGTPEDFFSSGMPGSDPSAPHFPAYLRYLVKPMEIMDGIQLWWLREPEVDLCEEWSEMENLLFPAPLWDAYR